MTFSLHRGRRRGHRSVVANFAGLNEELLEAQHSSPSQRHRAFVSKGASARTADVPGRGTLPRRFLIVKPCCQLCNRVRVLVASLALGILTDRAVIIEFDGTGHEGDYYGRCERAGRGCSRALGHCAFCLGR